MCFHKRNKNSVQKPLVELAKPSVRSCCVQGVDEFCSASASKAQVSASRSVCPNKEIRNPPTGRANSLLLCGDSTIFHLKVSTNQYWGALFSARRTKKSQWCFSALPQQIPVVLKRYYHIFAITKKYYQQYFGSAKIVRFSNLKCTVKLIIIYLFLWCDPEFIPPVHHNTTLNHITCCPRRLRRLRHARRPRHPRRPRRPPCAVRARVILAAVIIIIVMLHHVLALGSSSLAHSVCTLSCWIGFGCCCLALWCCMLASGSIHTMPVQFCSRLELHSHSQCCAHTMHLGIAHNDTPCDTHLHTSRTIPIHTVTHSIRHNNGTPIHMR